MQVPLIIDRAYPGNRTRWLTQAMGLEPVVPPLRTRRDPWAYDAEVCQTPRQDRARVRPRQTLRRVFTRSDKTDLTFGVFITVALFADMLK